MILADSDIKKHVAEGKIIITPYDVENVQSATVDFRLGNSFRIPNYDSADEYHGMITLDNKIDYHEVKKNEIVILPKHFILGTTLETLGLPNYLSARVDGKSSIGRKGLFTQNAGHIGPGFNGEITLELYNANDLPIKLVAGKPICQIEFHILFSPAEKVYRGRYQGQMGAQV
ncbi:dCTP deaminase [Candidatus Pacearchaeota archaeon CG10_big_fil_rev_8_21_14_0_10_30_48]|nr:MAG: dCTP deaminase [Candidatus Pacearchaeota archaeon CG10_big_fil_rev_8_21_14_0_10_30_48]